MFLTDAELQELTGRVYGKHRIAWLTANGWKFEIGADGQPKVLRAYAEQRMGLKPAPGRHEGPRLNKLAKAA